MLIYIEWIIALIHGANTGWGKTDLNLEFSLWITLTGVNERKKYEPSFK